MRQLGAVTLARAGREAGLSVYERHDVRGHQPLPQGCRTGSVKKAAPHHLKRILSPRERPLIRAAAEGRTCTKKCKPIGYRHIPFGGAPIWLFSGEISLSEIRYCANNSHTGYLEID